MDLKIEKKWWFIGVVSFVTALTSIPLLISAGTWPVTGFARGLVSLMCFYTINRFFSAMGRVVVMFAFHQKIGISDHKLRIDRRMPTNHTPILLKRLGEEVC